MASSEVGSIFKSFKEFDRKVFGIEFRLSLQRGFGGTFRPYVVFLSIFIGAIVVIVIARLLGWKTVASGAESVLLITYACFALWSFAGIIRELFSPTRDLLPGMGEIADKELSFVQDLSSRSLVSLRFAKLTMDMRIKLTLDRVATLPVSHGGGLMSAVGLLLPLLVKLFEMPLKETLPLAKTGLMIDILFYIGIVFAVCYGMSILALGMAQQMQRWAGLIDFAILLKEQTELQHTAN